MTTTFLSDDEVFENVEHFAVQAARNEDWVEIHKYFHKLALGRESSGWGKGYGMNQNQKLLNAMSNGRTVTRLTAMHMHIMNLTARITDLRALGHKIEMTWKEDTEGHRYGSFTLAS